MNVVCESCASTLSWNHKTDKPLAELACPHCGGRYRKQAPGVTVDPTAGAQLLLLRFERVAERIEAALSGLRDVGPALTELGRALSQVGGGLRLLQPGELSEPWDRDDRGTA